jgi:hypothetical protein
MEAIMKESIKSRLSTLFLISSVTAAGSKVPFSNQSYIFKNNIKITLNFFIYKRLHLQ